MQSQCQCDKVLAYKLIIVFSTECIQGFRYQTNICSLTKKRENIVQCICIIEVVEIKNAQKKEIIFD